MIECDGCGEEFPPDQITETEDEYNLCPECLDFYAVGDE